MLPELNKKIFLSFSLVLFFVSAANSNVRLSPNLEEAVNNLRNDDDSMINVVIFIEDQSARDAVFRTAQKIPVRREERIKSVIKQLKSFKAPNEEKISSFVNKYSTTPVIKHWVVPAYTATMRISKLEELSSIHGIKLIVENMKLNYESPVDISTAPQISTLAVSSQLTLLKVPELWRRGIKGQGRLVCSFDTGVEQNHPALSSRWRGNHTNLSSCWFSKVAPDTLPYDRIGHGTHTMGVMVGGTAADSFGVAPDAEWIAAGVIDQGRSLSMTLSDIIEAFQWALNPDGDENSTDDVPDVILNSWGVPKGLFIPCDDTFWGVIDNIEAAGVVIIFAAGNEGPDPQTIRSPADRATTPINSFAVGAVDNNKVITSFSSRGPSSCDNTQIKPEVVAPGVNIRSSTKGGGYTYMTGTSMAAPYIAGLVALIRQYNPDATVEQIKNAFILASEDLGAPGEDNEYGYGLVNALEVLNYIPSPTAPAIEVTDYQISDDGIALPGERFGLQVMLNNPPGNIETVTGTISAISGNSVSFVNDSADFYFGIGSTTAMNYIPFEVVFDSSLYHGQLINFQLILSVNTPGYVDTTEFSITVGVKPKGIIAAHINNKISLSVSDFGQFGFAPGSFYNVLGEGFRFNGSDNLLYEAGIILGRNNLQLSTSIRNDQGSFKTSDFTPVESLSDSWVGADGGIHRTAVFNDQNSNIPIPINVHQETINFDDLNDEGFLIIKYRLNNNSLENLSNLYFGFLIDYDLSDSDVVSFDESLSLIYQESQSGLLTGIVLLKNITSFQSITNDNAKAGFTNQELFNLISSSGTYLSDSISGDMMFLTSAGPFILEPEGTVEVAFALVGGGNINELYDNANRAKMKYELTTGINDNFNSTLPENFELSQNYPNPFNPKTNITFSLPKATWVSLDIYNVLGQKVKKVHHGLLPAGNHQFEWNATNQDGHIVAGGVYFYRLSTDAFTQSKKMLLLK